MNKKDKRIPLYFVLFFMVLIVIDGVFVYIATSTHRGVVTDHAYKKGLSYNDTIDAAASQQQLGWHGNISVEYPEIRFTLKQQNGKMIDDAEVAAYFIRPTQEGYDQSVKLMPVSNGQYNASFQLPLTGQWDVRILAIWNHQRYQTSKRIIIQ